MHENRETPGVSAQADRSGKATNPKPEATALAEVVEKRAQTKENAAQPNMSPTPSGERVSQGLGGARQAARGRKQELFTSLLHACKASSNR